MGMIQGLMKTVPQEKTPPIYLQEVLTRLPDFAQEADSYSAVILDPSDFDEAWNTQDNLHKTPEIRAKYHARTEQGRVIYVEIDW